MNGAKDSGKGMMTSSVKLRRGACVTPSYITAELEEFLAHPRDNWKPGTDSRSK